MVKLWTAWLAASFCIGGTLAFCDTGDTIGCDPFKTVECQSNVLDINFLLDRSSSMRFGMNCRKDDCGQSCKENYPTKYNTKDGSCFRQDIMRMVIRKVLKRIFQIFQQPCLEYLETEASRVGGCEAKGFTTTRYNLVWWSAGDGAKQTYLNQQFTSDAESLMGKSFANFFYEGDRKRKNGKWEEKSPGVYTMKESEINKYFDTELLKGTSSSRNDYEQINPIDPWPHGAGGTEPYGGMNAMVNVLKSAFEKYTPNQKMNARFPVFFMTDGMVTGGQEVYKKVVDEQNRLSTVTGNPDQMDFYGLGLTGAKAHNLREAQKNLYKDLGYKDEIIVDNKKVDLYFNDEATATKVIDALFKTVQDGCQDCYTFNNEKKCVKLGADPPEFSDDSSNETPPEEPNVYIDAGDEYGIENEEVSYDKFIAIGTDIIKIEKDTKVCRQFYKDGTGENKFDGYYFTKYTDELKCECCGGASGCICDYSEATVESIRTIKLGEGDNAYTMDIPVFVEDSYFARSVLAYFDATDNNDPDGLVNITNNLVDEETDVTDGGIEDDDEGPFNDGTDIDFDSVEDNNNDTVSGPVDNHATRFASRISLMALPVMAAMM